MILIIEGFGRRFNPPPPPPPLLNNNNNNKIINPLLKILRLGKATISERDYCPYVRRKSKPVGVSTG